MFEYQPFVVQISFSSQTGFESNSFFLTNRFRTTTSFYGLVRYELAERPNGPIDHGLQRSKINRLNPLTLLTNIR